MDEVAGAAAAGVLAREVCCEDAADAAGVPADDEGIALDTKQ